MLIGATLSNHIQNVIKSNMGLKVGDIFNIDDVQNTCNAYGVNYGGDRNNIRGALNTLYNEWGYIEKVDRDIPNGIYRLVVDTSEWHII